MKYVVFVVATAALMSLPAVAGDSLETCYKQAETPKDYQACLRLEYDLVKQEYDKALERVMTEARSVDRVQRHKTAAKSFTAANKAFLKYVNEECDWVAASYGARGGASKAQLACHINLIRMRTGALEAQFLSEDK